jgi:ElaB/YqjD/DUF883 family membrane-anchored ribosome-binding protein
MDDDPEVIRHQMEETRSSLTDKIERLEQTVTEKVQCTTAAVTDTVESVRGAVCDTVESVRGTVSNTVETVKETFDVRRYFREYPWAAFGASVGAGLVGGMALTTGSRNRGDRITGLRSRGQPFVGAGPAHDGGGPRRMREAQFTAAPDHGDPGWSAEISTKFGDELGKLKGVAVGAAFGFVRDWLRRSAPGEVGQRLGEVIDDLTRKFGGEPIRGNLLESFGSFVNGGKSRERDTPTEARGANRTAAGF